MGFFGKLFGKSDEQKVNNDSIVQNIPTPEEQGYVSLGRSIFPLLRNKNDPKFTMQMPKGSELCTKPIVGDLLLVYVFDTASNFQYINQNMLEKYAIQFDELESTALRNLFDKTAGNLQIQAIETKTEENPNGAPFYRIILDGIYDVSLLIGQSFLEKMKEVVEDEVLAFASPRTDTLLLSGITNQFTVAQMALTAGSLYINAINDNNNTALTNQIMIRKDVAWSYYDTDKFFEHINDI